MESEKTTRRIRIDPRLTAAGWIAVSLAVVRSRFMESRMEKSNDQ
jgi:hypothetical protein